MSTMLHSSRSFRFIEELLTEILLRTSPAINRIYLLIRLNKEKNASTRQFCRKGLIIFEV
ncbi:hypothetical protein V1477_013823 [Vespula maculifrons]|uniref:Uncharacterized protein n=1 Tax=Vespula maculifrons TaxID=7453 RepID=A0ABD2BPH4_VESMC